VVGSRELEAIVERLEAGKFQEPGGVCVGLRSRSQREILTGGEGLASEWKDFATVMRLLEYRILVENPRLAQLLSALQSSSPLR
jgi:hypothetical protein